MFLTQCAMCARDRKERKTGIHRQSSNGCMGMARRRVIVACALFSEVSVLRCASACKGRNNGYIQAGQTVMMIRPCAEQPTLGSACA